jgi:hypothetical protein
MARCRKKKHRKKKETAFLICFEGNRRGKPLLEIK